MNPLASCMACLALVPTYFVHASFVPEDECPLPCSAWAHYYGGSGNIPACVHVWMLFDSEEDGSRPVSKCSSCTNCTVHWELYYDVDNCGLDYPCLDLRLPGTSWLGCSKYWDIDGILEAPCGQGRMVEISCEPSQGGPQIFYESVALDCDC